MALTTLRNPAGRPATIAIDAANVFELPDDAPRRYTLKSPYADQRKTVESLTAGAPARPRAIGKYNVLRAEDLDGYKFFVDAPRGNNGAEAWVLLRGSGTEPLLRVYCEAAAPETVNEILDAAVAFVHEG